MQQFTATDITVYVHTRKQGLLSKIAHDLCFESSVAAVEFSPDGAGSVRIDPMSIRLVGAERDGAVDPALLSVSDRRRVLANLRQDVLDVRRYPVITYTWTSVQTDGAAVRMAGELQLHGASRPLTLSGAQTADTVRLTVTLDQRDFGITPYSAAFGALKVHPELRIEVELPAETLKAVAD